VLASVIFYFWGLGFLDGSKSKDLHKVNYTLESILKKKPVQAIQKLVLDENNKIALSGLDNLEKELKEINDTVSDSNFSQISDELQQIKSNVASLVSFTKTDKVIEIFNDRVKNFLNYVEKNNWRTLTRSTNRVLSMSSGYVNKNRLETFTKKVENEMSLMKKATLDSILTQSEKKEIIKKLDGFNTELKMLKKYQAKKKQFIGMIRGYSKTLNAWIGQISPEISVQKLKLEQMGKYFIMSLFGILSICTALFAGGFFYNKKQRVINSEKFEDFIKEYVSENLIKGKMLELSSFSESFNDYSLDTQSYIDKRMSFGQIFQQALPFSSMLLDSNLKLEWANNEFCDDWNIDKENLKTSNISWDFLIKFTNLKDNDPIIEAVRNNIAGIYQVQLQLNDSNENKPFEMYVSPVKCGNETKVMTFFYPLESLEETINDQAKSIIDPVNRLLRSVSANSTNLSEIGAFESEFKQANISNLFGSFKTYFRENDKQKVRLFDEIEVLNSKMNEYEDILLSLESENSIIKSNLEQFQDGLKVFKLNIIQLFESHEDQSLQFNLSKDLISQGLVKFQKVSDGYSNIVDLSNLSITSLTKMGEFKNKLKFLRSNLDESKARLSHSIGQMVHLKNKFESTDLKSKYLQVYNKINDEFSNFSVDLKSLEKEIVSIEVLMSKNDMLLGSFQAEISSINLDQENFEVNELRHSFNGLSDDFDNDVIQGDIIESLQEMFSGYKDSKSHVSKIESHLHSRTNYSGFLANSDQGQINP
jgi:hypothetical protein